MGVGIRLFPVTHVAFLGIALFVVLLCPVGCEPLGFGFIFCSVLVWFVCIWMCTTVRRWVLVGHDARGWEGHVDARWRLRTRAVFNGGLGLCGCF